MKLIVNQQNIENFTLEDEKTIGDVLNALEQNASENKATLIEIKLNGNPVEESNFEEVLKTEIKDDTVLEVSTISTLDICDALKNVGVKMEELSKSLEQIPVLLQTGKNNEADQIIVDFTNSIDYFCHLTTLTSLFPSEFEGFKIDNNDILSFFNEFQPLISDFAEAYESKDMVTVGDLAEYEISPRMLKIANSIKQCII